MNPFRIVTEFDPRGDQPQAIEKLVEGVRRDLPHQVLMGVTGSGKTFTIAKVIEAVQKPALIIAHSTQSSWGQVFPLTKESVPSGSRVE